MVTQEGTAQECRLQGALKNVKESLQNETVVLPGTVAEVKAVKEKDVLLQEVQEQAAWEHQLRDMKEKVRKLLKIETVSLPAL